MSFEIPYKTLTPILGTSATYNPSEETTPIFMNGKFNELLENDKALENQINVLNADNNNWLENVELKKHRKQGRYVCINNTDSPIANEFIWCTLDVYNMNEDNSVINFTINGNLYSCREDGGVWGDWEPSHTLSQIQELNKRITDLEALTIN